MTWEKVDHWTGKPYKRKGKSGGWTNVDYISGDFRITEMFNGDKQLSMNGIYFGVFKTIKAAKAYAESFMDHVDE